MHPFYTLYSIYVGAVCLGLRARNRGHGHVTRSRPARQGSWMGGLGCQECKNVAFKVMRVVSTWGPCIPQKHQKMGILQPSLHILNGAVYLC